jgi:ATP-dependent Clp protease protease subunit
MEKIDLVDAPVSDRKGRFFARSVGTAFKAYSAESGATQIDLFDEIGYWGTTAKDFRDRLSGASDVVLRINSPGGDVMDGVAIYNQLIAHKGKVRVEVLGMAASSASIIAMAGDEIAMAKNAFMMIHNSWTIAMVDRHSAADIGTFLGKIDAAMARTYADRTKKGVRSVAQMMDDETWMTAKEAVDQGFATEIMASVEAKAAFDLSCFRNAPAALKRADEELEARETEEDIEKLLMRDAGRSRSQARALIRDIRAGNTSKTATRDAGGVRLDDLRAAAKSLASTLPKRNS